MRANLFLTAVVLLLSMRVTLAEGGALRQCNGIWTDRDCAAVPNALPGGSGSVSIKQRRGPAPEPTSREAEKLFTQLDLDRLIARRKYGVELDVRSAQDLCVGTAVRLPECRTEVAALHRQLETLVASAKQAGTTKQAGAESTSSSSSSANSVGQVNQVIVIQNHDLDDRWNHRKHSQRDFEEHRSQSSSSSTQSMPPTFEPRRPTTSSWK